MAKGRNTFSNRTLTGLILGSNWTRDVPLGFQARTIPGVTPAHEFGTDGKGSGDGRGATVFDVWRKTEIGGGIVVEQAAGFKVYSKKDLPTAPVITTGTNKHIEAVVKAVEDGTPIPLIILVNIKGTDRWFAACYDLADLVSKFGIQQATKGRGKGRGQGKAVVVGTKAQNQRYTPKFGAEKIYHYEYIYLAVNIKVAGVEWVEVDIDTFDWEAHVGTYL